MMRIALLLLTTSVALASEPVPHASPLFEGFQHDAHNAYWGMKELDCTSCHTFKEGGAAEFTEPLQTVCHQCHVTSDESSAIVEKTCVTCHKLPEPGSVESASKLFKVFAHDTHNNFWAMKDLACTSCHTFTEGGGVEFTEPLNTVCHQCHVSSEDTPAIVEKPCQTCHTLPGTPAPDAATISAAPEVKDTATQPASTAEPAAPTAPDAPAPPGSPLFSAFQHGPHNNYWGMKGLDCTSCHTFTQGGGVELTEPVQTVCHQCHVGSTDAPAMVEKPCQTCHTTPAEEPTEHASEIFGVFKHEPHNNYWSMKDLDCTSCHTFTAGGGVKLTEPLNTACHQCHVSSADSPAMVEKPCETCHTTTPVPSSHGAGWLPAHGVEAQANIGECQSCHKTAFCVDCHERKQTSTFKVHDRSWLSIHGMAARSDPSSCDSCHIKSGCVQCHQAAGGRWP